MGMKRDGRRRGYRPYRPRRNPIGREGNTIIFHDRADSMAHRFCTAALREAVDGRGYEDLILDFSRIDRAYPDGMVPLICEVVALRRAGVDFSLVLPKGLVLERLFLNTNWAHFLSPDDHTMSDTVHERHLAVHQFRGPSEQQALVTALMDVVMRSMHLQREAISGLEWSMNEVTDNVLNHAECVDGGFVQVSTFAEGRSITLAVCDAGQGIRASLQPAFPTMTRDDHALGEAVKAGVTRSPDAGQGNGLAGTLRVATMSGGRFDLTSGRAHLGVVPGSSESHPRPAAQNFSGTLVVAQLGTESSFSLAEALGFGGEPMAPVDLIEVQYESENGQQLVLSLKEETSGFGTRFSGLQLRTKCMNLLQADPTKPLIIDWSGIPIISSSFADELLGKLFVELGPTGFAARVRNVGMEATIRGLIDKAIMERTVQAMTSPRLRDGEGTRGAATD